MVINSITASSEVNCDSLTATASLKVGGREQDDAFSTMDSSLIATTLFSGDSIEVNQVNAPVINTFTESELRNDDEGYILTSTVKCSTISNTTGTEGTDVDSLIKLVNGINVDDLIDLVNLYKANQLVTINQNQEYVMNATRGDDNTVEFSNVSFTLPSE